MAGVRRTMLAGLLATLVITAGACSSSNDTSTTSTSGTSAPSGSTGTTTGGTGKKTSTASSDEIKLWQTQLNAVGCDAGPVDGVDGGETEAAIRNFQASAGLPVDGVVGPETETALAKDSASGTQVCSTGTTTTSKATTPSSQTSSSQTPTTAACPGPGCVDFHAEPSSGPAGSTITVKAASGACTITGVVALNPTDPAGPSIASGSISPQGMNQWEGTITVPAGTKPGSYLVNAWATAAMINAGECQAPFTVTG